MFKPSEIQSLTDFQRNARAHIDRLKHTGRAEVLTVNGRAEIVIQDARAYEDLLELVERAEAVLGIQRGLDAMRTGSGQSAEEAFRGLRERMRDTLP